jgi:hypothetical protein
MPHCDLMINMQHCAIMTAPAAGINPATITIRTNRGVDWPVRVIGDLIRIRSAVVSRDEQGEKVRAPALAREHRPPPRSVQCASQYAPREEFGGGFASGPVSCEQRLSAAAISAATIGQCTTSAMPATIRLSASISSVDFVASTIGR